MKLLEVPIFIASRNVRSDITLFFDEIYDLALFSQLIGNMPSLDLFNEYKAMLLRNIPYAFLEHLQGMGRIIGKYCWLSLVHLSSTVDITIN